MIYLTTNHQTPPQHVRHNGMLYPTAPLIAQGNTSMLAQLGIYPHYSNTQQRASVSTAIKLLLTMITDSSF